MAEDGDGWESSGNGSVQDQGGSRPKEPWQFMLVFVLDMKNENQLLLQ